MPNAPISCGWGGPGLDDSNNSQRSVKGKIMLYWAAVFLVIALIAALFGFTGVYLAAAGIAKILFVVFLVLFLISLLFGGIGRRPVL
jgi:uncharacterized membrane protein YtjA (UPF0391 family)